MGIALSLAVLAVVGGALALGLRGLGPDATGESPPVATEGTEGRGSAATQGSAGVTVPDDAEKPGAGASPEGVPSTADPRGTPSEGAAAANGESGELAAARPSPSDVQVKVASRPPGARLFIDGKPQGTTPASLTLARGVNTLIVVSHEGRTARRELTPERDGEEILLVLPKKRSIPETTESPPSDDALPF